MDSSPSTQNSDPAAAAISPAARRRPAAKVTVSADEQDILWMMRIRSGDREAFGELVECHQQRVVGTIARMLGGVEITGQARAHAAEMLALAAAGDAPRKKRPRASQR